MNRRFSIPFVAVFLLFVACGAVAAQSTPGLPVQLVVTVEPKKGDEIPNITRQDMVVHQGHDVRPITDWVPANGERAGLAMAILIDDSSGFSLATQLNDLRAFILQQQPTTLVAVGYMQNGTVFLAQDFTQDHRAAAESLRLTQGFLGAEASPYLSLSDFIKRLPSNAAVPRREILAITSGIDSVYMGAYPNPYVDTAIHDAQCNGILVYSIYTPIAGHFGHSHYRTFWGQNYLSELSEMTGAESFYFLDQQGPVSFAPYLDQLNHQLASQFLMTFLAKPAKKAGTESVKVTSEIRSVDFMHAGEVCVPASLGQ